MTLIEGNEEGVRDDEEISSKRSLSEKEETCNLFPEAYDHDEAHKEKK
jgi:hypothetical protein